SLRDLRYVELDRIDALDERAAGAFEDLTTEMVAFVLADGAFAPYHARVDELAAEGAAATTATAATQVVDGLATVADEVALLTEVIEGLHIDDPTERTRVLEAVSE